MTAPIWLFGYGSLLWRPDFAYLERRASCLRGWARRFWQGSTDHRGVPGAPGRVVTLTPSPNECCWGIAYRIDVDIASAALVNLDHREKGGYIRRNFKLYTPHERSLNALTYFASPDNPHYLGAAPVSDIAAQVYGASGPSGSNIDYVLRLAKALRELEVVDPHVMEIETLVEAKTGAPCRGE